MNVKRKDLPNLYKPIYKRLAAITVALNSCNTYHCPQCKYFKSEDCYKEIANEMVEAHGLLGRLVNGVKKMD